VRAVLAIAVSIYLGPAGGGALFGGGGIGAAIANGAVAGFASGVINSGTLKGGLQGALSGALFSAAGFAGGHGPEFANTAERYIAHATAGCISFIAGGGKCGQGAANALFGKFTSNATENWGVGVAQGVATAVAGGVGSVIAGGKFANGAVTAAYGYLYNAITSWQLAENMSADGLREAGWKVEQGVEIVMKGLPGELDKYGVADFLATKNGELLIGEVKDGLGAKLSPFQKALFSSPGALERLTVASAERAQSLGLIANKILVAQLSVDAKIMLTLTGSLNGRAAGEAARRMGGNLATRVAFGALRAVGSTAFTLITMEGNVGQ
jgi:hypothetical protein